MLWSRETMHSLVFEVLVGAPVVPVSHSVFGGDPADNFAGFDRDGADDLVLVIQGRLTLDQLVEMVRRVSELQLKPLASVVFYLPLMGHEVVMAVVLYDLPSLAVILLLFENCTTVLIINLIFVVVVVHISHPLEEIRRGRFFTHRFFRLGHSGS